MQCTWHLWVKNRAMAICNFYEAIWIHSREFSAGCYAWYGTPFSYKTLHYIREKGWKGRRRPPSMWHCVRTVRLFFSSQLGSSKGFPVVFYTWSSMFFIMVVKHAHSARYQDVCIFFVENFRFETNKQKVMKSHSIVIWKKTSSIIL